MKSFIRYLCFCTLLLLPFAAHAKSKFTGEVLFRNRGNEERHNELWITHIENTKNARLLYKHNEKDNHNKQEAIHTNYAVQKDGPLIAFCEWSSASDIHLINRNQLRKGARNLTKNRFNSIRNVDISANGDILFTNSRLNPFPEVIQGLYLMPNDEVKKVKPQATLLKKGLISFFRWSPNSEQFIYLDRTGTGYYLYNLRTGEDSLIIKDKERSPLLYPAFSPDGKKLAFIYQPKIELGVELDVISLETLYPQLLPNDPHGDLRFSRSQMAYGKVFCL